MARAPPRPPSPAPAANTTANSGSPTHFELLPFPLDRQAAHLPQPAAYWRAPSRALPSRPRRVSHAKLGGESAGLSARLGGGGGGGNWGTGGWRITGAEAGGAVSLFREPSPLQVPRLCGLGPCHPSPPPPTTAHGSEKRPRRRQQLQHPPPTQPWKTWTSRLWSRLRPRTARPGVRPHSSTSS